MHQGKTIVKVTEIHFNNNTEFGGKEVRDRPLNLLFIRYQIFKQSMMILCFTIQYVR